MHACAAGHHWRKLAPVQILALVAEYREREDEQVVVLFQVLAAEINFGYKFQTVRPPVFRSKCTPRSALMYRHCIQGWMDSRCCRGLPNAPTSTLS